MTATTKPKKDPIRDGLRIYVTEENRGFIQAALDQVQGKSYADILDATDIFTIARNGENALARAGIAASYRRGALYTSTPSGPCAKAYRFARDGTKVDLEYKTKGWVLIGARRIGVWPRVSGRQFLTLTQDHKRLAMRNFLNLYSISKDEAHAAVDTVDAG